jgi:SAM-dependent methyltransferase
MKEEKPWYDRDDFWLKASPVLFHEQRILNTPSEADKIISLTKINPGMHVLDLCCGIGRHSLELARRGYKVTGVDRTTGYLEKAAGRAKAENLNAEFINDDMRHYCRPEKYDAVLNLFTSFGYFEDPGDDRRVILNIFSSLKRDGVLLMEMMGKEVLARVFSERDWREIDGAIVMEERKIIEDWSRMDMCWRVLKEGKLTDLRLAFRLYSGAELKGLLISCGFAAVEILGNLEGAPYDHQASRLIALARK